MQAQKIIRWKKTAGATLERNEFAKLARPRSRHAHWHAVGDRGQLFIVNGSRVFDVDFDILQQFDAALEAGDIYVAELINTLGLFTPDLINETKLIAPPVHALSLAIAQKCNLGCTYCYASKGDFGVRAKSMSIETALKAVELMIHNAATDARLNLAFLGGEPLTNRATLQAATEHAALLCAERGIEIGFSITTNGTLLKEADAEFFEKHAFAVTISLDGTRDAHNRQRPFKNGSGSFDQIIQRAASLLSQQRQMQISVRATVTPDNLQIRETLDYCLNMNFHSVGFSPVLHSPTGQGECSEDHLDNFLGAMIECGVEFERKLMAGKRYAFANIINALREIHKGTHRPYPCGAGAGYMGVSADGQLAACHRFVEDSNGAMGDLQSGIDKQRQNRWLADRHVHAQSPCSNCWARYLCGGGCHHEVIARGRPACDFIRGWLAYCLQAYARMSLLCPEWFDNVDRLN